MTLVLNNENFLETIKEWVTLVDFWAEWCGPCQIMLPILEDFAKDQEWVMKVWKVNVDENPDIAASFRVMSIPTLILFKDWQPVDAVVWVRQKQELEEIVSKYL